MNSLSGATEPSRRSRGGLRARLSGCVVVPGTTGIDWKLTRRPVLVSIVGAVEAVRVGPAGTPGRVAGQLPSSARDGEPAQGTWFGADRGAWTLPVALAVIAQVDVWAGAPLNLGHLVGPAWVVALVYVVTALALVWRRRAPVVVLAFIVSLDAAVYLTYGAPEGLGSLLPTVVAVYAVGRWSPPGAVVVAAPLAALGVVVHELTDPIYAVSGANAVFYAVVVAAWPLGNAFRRRAAQAADLRQQAVDLTQRGEAVAREAVDAERARIARELHDIVGHGLSLIVLQQVGASAALDKSMVPEAQELLANSERVARDTLTEMRRLLGLLRAGSAADGDLRPQPGIHDLGMLTRDAELAGATVRTEVSGIPIALSPGLDLTAYRILQESLTNVLKHARPPDCEVCIAYEPDHLRLEVTDRGRPVAAGPPGRGLAGMAERVSIYNGTLAYGPAPTGGFAVLARLPLRA